MSVQAFDRSINYLKPFFSLSRTPHGILDVSITGLSALLWLGYFPSIGFICLGLLTAFAGYTAIYALNDLISYKEDREKMDGQDDYQGYSVEATAMRHPVAQNFLSMQAGVTWFLMWSCVAMIGAYVLNPVILAIFLVGGVLEAIYCLLLKRTCLRVLISGVVKTCGPIAAVFAATPEPSITFLSILFFWVFFWEIGGQNIPADWNDVSEDLRVNAKTIPAQFGPKRSSLIILSVLGLSVLFSLKLLDISPINFGLVEFTVCFAIGCFLLLVPAYRLYRSQGDYAPAVLFDRASYYPLAILALTGFKLLLEYL